MAPRLILYPKSRAINILSRSPRLCSFAQKNDAGFRYPISGARLPYTTNSDKETWKLLVNLNFALCPAIYFSSFLFALCISVIEVASKEP